MKLIKFTLLKWFFLLMFPMILFVACSSYKSIKDGDESAIITNTGTKINPDNSIKNEIFDEQENKLQLQDLKVNNIIYFDLNKYDIHFEYTQLLDFHINFLKKNPYLEVTIEGHTDERGTPEYNIALGERRAKAIKTYLQNKGISADKMSIISYGKEKPAVLGHDEIAYAKNRRAILIY